MSLVETAIKKLQSAAKGQSAIPDHSLALRKSPHSHSKIAEIPTDGALIPMGRTVQIDTAQLQTVGLLPPPEREREIAQQYRHIKRPLIAAALGRTGAQLPNGRIILISSAMPGDGKTFTCLNLALSLALEKDLNVLLVDADLAKQHISRQLGVTEERGLLDVLRDQGLGIEHAILPTNVPRLSLLPAGRRSDDATELVASARAEQVFRELLEADAERILLLDSSPLLLTTESLHLAQIAGQVVVVVRAGGTSQSVLHDALSHIRQGPAVSLVLNQVVTAPLTGYHYDYGSADWRDTESE